MQKPMSFYISNSEKLFSQYTPEYGVNENEEWILEGEENIYRSVFNLVNHIDKISVEKELSIMIKTSVLIRLIKQYLENQLD